MSELKVFHKTVIGASHISSGKSCQDYSVSFDEDGIQAAVVCDGHGGSSYVRSDKGAELAANVTVDCLRNFARCIPETMFSGKSFSITAKPQRNPFIDADGRKLRFEDMDETHRQYARQAESYFDSVDCYPEQQKIVVDLLGQIYTAWIKAVREDIRKQPFNKRERSAKNNLDDYKAYGCTLLAFLKTPWYWLAFQIGDGTIYCCDEKLSWKKPVPNDCSCFLNYTTSLCDADPIAEFRYAFSGAGDMPVATMLCSDGVDGSLRTEENLQDFYEQIIGLFLDGDDIEEELQGYLPKLSDTGNHDDMSIAGIVDFGTCGKTDIMKSMAIKKKARGIKKEYRTKKTEIEAIENRIDTLEIKLERQKDSHFMKKSELEEMKQEVAAKENEVSGLEKSIEAIKKELKELRESLKTKELEFDSWRFTIKNEMAELEAELHNDDNNNGDAPINQNSIQNW